MKPRRPARPKAKYPGVFAVWSGGQWKWIARFRGGSKLRTGKVRLTQEEANDDYRKLVRDGDLPTFKVSKTLGQGLKRATKDAEERGVSEITLRKYYGPTCRFILRFWDEAIPLKLLTTKEIVWFINEALKEGRNPNTLIEGDLPLIGRAIQTAGLPSPVAEAKKLTRLRKKPRVKLGMEFNEALAFVDAIRNEGLPRSVFHADVAELVLWTGARSSEVAGLTIDSIDLRRKLLRLDGKTGLHVVPIPPQLVGPLKRLRDEAREAGRDALVPGGMAGMGQILQRCGKRLGYHANGRALRHTLALGMLESGASLDEVRDQLGHADVTTTAEYINRRMVPRGDALERLRRHHDLPDPDESEPTA